VYLKLLKSRSIYCYSTIFLNVIIICTTPIIFCIYCNLIDTLPLNNWRVIEGTAVTFRCFTQPPVSGVNVQWTRDGVTLRETRHSLSIINATVNDTGVYCCGVDGTVVNCGSLFTGGVLIEIFMCIIASIQLILLHKIHYKYRISPII